MYGTFAYNLVRSDFTKLISLFGGLFILSYQLIKMYGWNFKLLLGLGIFFRIIFLFATPNLSQDFYRFIWDGQVLMQGFSPYLVSPEAYLQNPSLAGFVIPQAEDLYIGMGMPSIANFTNYPPMNQLCFALATFFGGKSIIGSVIGLRIIIILADIGILYFGKKILEKLNLPIQNIFWYFLNPFIIIELTGNLHFEGVMLFFFVVSIFFLQKNKWLLSAVFLGLSVSTKLIPLIFLPLFFQWFWKKEYSFPEGIANLTKYYLVALGTVIITFLPFLSSEFMTNYLATNALWFQNFEFNASIYYIIREIGFQIVGWNIIETVGKILPLIVIAFIIGITFFRKNTSFI